MKTFAKGVLSRLGYDLRTRPELGFTASTLSRICSARTVIDVGVGYGTLPLYEAFPDAHFVLVEPLEEYEASIRKIAGEYRCNVYRKAVGEKKCRLEMLIDARSLQKSSLWRRAPLTDCGRPLQRRMVDVTTLDAIYREHPSLARPVLLKIDVEGHELAALRGATSLLGIVDAAIIEVSIARRFEGGYEFEDVLRFMNERGFYLFSFLKMMRRRGQIRQSFADVVFKRREEEEASA